MPKLLLGVSAARASSKGLGDTGLTRGCGQWHRHPDGQGLRKRGPEHAAWGLFQRGSLCRVVGLWGAQPQVGDLWAAPMVLGHCPVLLLVVLSGNTKQCPPPKAVPTCLPSGDGEHPCIHTRSLSLHLCCVPIPVPTSCVHPHRAPAPAAGWLQKLPALTSHHPGHPKGELHGPRRAPCGWPQGKGSAGREPLPSPSSCLLSPAVGAASSCQRSCSLTLVQLESAAWRV